VLGPALDGGYWLVGLSVPDPRAFAGVPMSTPTTMARQEAQLLRCGYRVARAAVLRDLDTADDARALSEAIPGSRTARQFARLTSARRRQPGTGPDRRSAQGPQLPAHVEDGGDGA
jgi:uncharacterized protein